MENKNKIESAFFAAILATIPFATTSPEDAIYVPDDYVR